MPPEAPDAWAPDVHAPDAWADVVKLVELSRPSPMAPHDRRPRPARRHRGWLVATAFLIWVVLPTAIVGTYFGAFAVDRYVSEARFVVRKPNAPGRMLPQSLSIEEGPKAVGGDDSFAVQDFILSRDAFRLVLSKAGLREAVARQVRDPLWQFPGLLTGRSDEDLFELYTRLVSVEYESSTGLTTLITQGFDAAQASRIATVLMDGAEDLLNRLNDRARTDALRVARAEVDRTRAIARVAQDRVTAFRSRESVIDPTLLSKTVLETIGTLSLQLVEAAAQLDVTTQAAPNSPAAGPLRARIRALQAQIDHERNALAGSDRSFAPKIAEYERVMLERDFAEKSFISALGMLETAQLDGLRRQAYLERVVSPGVPDEAHYPRRLLWIGGTFLLGLALFRLFRPRPGPRAARFA